MNHKNRPQENQDRPFDLSEEASSRSDDSSTTAARNAESDDSQEETSAGRVPGPEEGDNRVWTSLSED
jgi:hypothetical protein